MNKHKKDTRLSFRGLLSNYWVIYTLCFTLIAFSLFFIFESANRSLIWSWDGKSQYYPNLVYTGQYLKELLPSLMKGKFPMYDFSIGMGDDVLAVLNLYPLSLLAGIWPETQMELLYGLLIVVRLYLSGAAFSMFCLYWKKKKAAVLCGSLIYVFSGYAVQFGLKHPFFLSGMIFLPLMLWGTERILQEKKSGWFILITVSGLISGVYLYYICSLAWIGYVALRMISCCREAGGACGLKKTGRVIGAYLIGAGLSAPWLLPSVIRIISSGRVEGTSSETSLLFCGWERLFSFVVDMVCPSIPKANQPVLILSVLVIPVLAVLLAGSWKSHAYLKIALAVEVLVLIIPAGGLVLSAFSEVNDRWLFIMDMTLACACVWLWAELLAVRWRTILWMVGLTAAWWLCLGGARDPMSAPYIDTGRWMLLLLEVVLIVLWLFNAGVIGGKLEVVKSRKQIGKRKAGKRGSNRNGKTRGLQANSRNVKSSGLHRNSRGESVNGSQESTGDGKANGLKAVAAKQDEWSGLILTAVVGVLLAVSVCKQYDPDNYEIYAYEMKGNAQQYYDDRKGRTEALSQIGDTEEFGRVELADTVELQEDICYNAAMLAGYFGTAQYSSMVNPLLREYLLEQWNAGGQLSILTSGLGGRVAALALGSVKYALSRPGQAVPYGFEAVRGGEPIAQTGEILFENRLALPIGYMYEQVIEEADYQKLTPVEKELVMAEAAVISSEEGAGGLKRVTGGTLNVEEEEIRLVPGIGEGKREFFVEQSYEQIEFTYPVREGCVMYLVLEGLRSDDEIGSIYLNLKNSRQLVTSQNSFGIYAPQAEGYVLNLGYGEQNGTGRGSLEFTNGGRYMYDSAKVVYYDAAALEEHLNRLKEKGLTEIEMDTNRISGRAVADQPSYLVFSVPYDSGWSVWVDGIRKDVQPVNSMYLGVPLEAGTHEVELRYRTRGMREGMLILGMTLLILGGAKLRRHGKREDDPARCEQQVE